MGMLTTADLIIIVSFALLLLVYKIVRDWYGIREIPRKIDEKAAELLRDEGYFVQARAAVKFIDFDIEGRSHRQRVKADLIVRRGLKKYVVEVNAQQGEASAMPTFAAGSWNTRLPLLPMASSPWIWTRKEFA